ncbi:hypothetical protein AB434_1916 [Heyndrickxia coagulans]|nr:hypothetical protein AB434_1916 [Heyndrickxia coagulans]
MTACIRFLTVGWRFLAIFQCLTHGSTVSRPDFHQVPFLSHRLRTRTKPYIALAAKNTVSAKGAFL